MAKGLIDVKAGKLTDGEKAAMKADKLFLSLLGQPDNVRREVVRRLQSHNDVVDQQGDGQGKRFSGAADHTPESNARAFAATVTRGAIVRIAE